MQGGRRSRPSASRSGVDGHASRADASESARDGPRYRELSRGRLLDRVRR
jgi:hypothetical protein